MLLTMKTVNSPVVFLLFPIIAIMLWKIECAMKYRERKKNKETNGNEKKNRKSYSYRVCR